VDLYLIQSRRRPAPLGLAVIAIIGMIIWAFTAQGKAAAASADRPSETAHRLDNQQALAIEGTDDLDDLNATDGDSDSGSGGGGGAGGTDSSGGGGGSESSGGGGGGGGGSESSGGGGGGGGESDSSAGGSGDDSGGDSGGGDTSGDTSGGGNPPPGGNNPPPGGNNPPPGGNNPPPGGNNPPPAGGVLGGNPPIVVLPNTAMSAEGGTSTGLVAGLVVLAAAGATGLRRFVGGRVEDR
jgi:hypothetical protein